MTFQQLRYLLEVQRTGSISRAADNLYVSRPSVSFCINSLEEEIGYPIFLRTRQGLVPSRQGKQFLEYAEQIFNTYRLMNNITAEKSVRTINISSFPYLPITVASKKLLEEYKDDHTVSFSFNVHNYTEIIEGLAHAKLDLALFARFASSQGKIEQMMAQKGLRWKILGTIQTAVYIGPGHKLFHKPDLSLQDFENDYFLDTSNKEVSSTAILRRNLHIPENRIIPCNNAALKNYLIDTGLAYSIGRMPAAADIRREKLRYIPIPELSQPLFCAYNPAYPMAPEVERFMALVEENLKIYN